MKKTVIVLMLFFTSAVLVAQKPSLTLKAFQRYYISGLPPNPVLEVGGKEVAVKDKSAEPEYFIYLVTDLIPDLKIESVWIKKQLYQATMQRVACQPVVINNVLRKDTLVKFTGENVWQIMITGKEKNLQLSKKNISPLVLEKELVVKLRDRKGRTYTKTVKHFISLESERGQ